MQFEQVSALPLFAIEAHHVSGWAVALFLVDLLIRLGISIRVIMRRRPVGVTLAWMAVVLLVPFFGAFIYLLFGETRIGSRRAKYTAELHDPIRAWLGTLPDRYQVDWTDAAPGSVPLARLTESAVGVPALPGNELELFDHFEAIFQAIIADIDRAERTCHLLFYIWAVGGLADDVAEALLRAVERGVRCRVLVDDLGSKAFLASPLARRLRDGGVELQAALPMGLVRSLSARTDLRMHRKIVVIDGQIGYTGSQNLVDPRYFKQDSGVGQWVDAMVRVRGPAVEALAITFLGTWELDANEGVEKLRQTGDAHHLEEVGGAPVQVVPSGPMIHGQAIGEVLLMAVYSAKRELVLTTPYFVPEESLLTALISAARRGVEVTLVVPAKVDSLLVRYASQAFKDDLVAAGVRIAAFEGGLVHTKSITIDGEISLFGSVNLDPRSIYLNFEITLAIYDAEFTARLRKLQQSYIDGSKMLDLAGLESRPATQRFGQNVARLMGPLL